MSVPNTPLRCVGQPGLPVFSQHILQHPVIQREFPHETLQLSVLPLQRPEALDIRDLHTPKLPTPAIQDLFVDIVLTAHLSDAVQRLGLMQNPNNLLF